MGSWTSEGVRCLIFACAVSGPNSVPRFLSSTPSVKPLQNKKIPHKSRGETHKTCLETSKRWMNVYDGTSYWTKTKNFHMFETKHALKPPLYRRNFMGFLSSLQLATSRYPNIGLPSHLHSRPWHGAPSDVFGIFLAPIFGISRREALNSPWNMVPKPKHTPNLSFLP